jgi:serine/threonine-protein kinase
MRWKKDGMEMVYVPAGEFLMGSPEGEGDDDEHPQHTVYLDAFWIDKTEVTNAMFANYVESTNYKTTAEREGCGWIYLPDEIKWKCVDGADWQHPFGPKSSLAGLEKFPVVIVSWYDARAYCHWAGKRLPTEAEWEKAARGPDGRTYPWGDQWDVHTTRRLNFADKNTNFNWSDEMADDGYEYAAPVGSYPAGASPYGALDMAGNVWEWSEDWFSEKYYVQSPHKNPTGPTSGESRVLRGGSWYHNQEYSRIAIRDKNEPSGRSANLGFRCVLSVSP